MKLSAVLNTLVMTLIAASASPSSAASATEWTAIECELTTGIKGAQPSLTSDSATVARSSMTTPSEKETIGAVKLQGVDVTVLVTTYLPGNPVLSISAYLPESDGLMLSAGGDGQALNLQLMQPSKGRLRSLNCRMK